MNINKEILENDILHYVSHIINQNRMNQLSIDQGMLLRKNFFGVDIDLDPKDLVYIVVLLEEKYSFRFSNEDFDSPDFFTPLGLSKIAYQRVALNAKKE